MTTMTARNAERRPEATDRAPKPGLFPSEKGVLFRVFADAQRVRLRLLHPGTREMRLLTLEQGEKEEDGALWTGRVDTDLSGWSYAYEVERDGMTLSDLVDPWAPLVHQGRGYIVRDTTPVTPRPAFDPGRAVIYELHIRDFTRDPACGVRPDWRGRFLGLTQSGTRLDGTAFPTGLDHIVELGVNVVQLMPVHSFALPYHPEYEWGYMPFDFNAPHAGYASGVELDAPIKEFKRLVSTLHERGLRVTLDVVYNHTAERWPDRFRGLMGLAPRAYFRFKDDGTAWDGSACGNEFRSESRRGREFVLDSVEMWVRTYGVDGFRFDLMGLIDTETMELLTKRLHAIDPTILVYGEPWAGGPTPIEVNNKGKQRGKGWGVFNDDFRDGARGEVFKPEAPGFLASGENIERLKSAVLAGVTTFAGNPLECINYIECHDNHTLSDRLALTAPAKEKFTEEQRLDMNAMGAMLLLTSQGIPFLHSGQEFGRTKNGEDNTYNLGDQINNIRWQDKADRHRLFSFYRAMIRLRLDHPMFRLTDADLVRKSVKFLDSDLHMALPAGVLAWRIEDPTGEDAWSHAVLMFNGSREAAVVPLPEAPAGPKKPARRATDNPAPGARGWRLAAIDSHVADDGREHHGSIKLPAHFGAVLYAAR